MKICISLLFVFNHCLYLWFWVIVAVATVVDYTNLKRARVTWEVMYLLITFLIAVRCSSLQKLTDQS